MATVNYTLPIYEAVVCNLALEKMRQDEVEQEQEKLLAKTLECVALSKELLKLLNEQDFSAITQDAVAQTHVALCVLISIGRQSVSSQRATLPHICTKYRDALATAVADMDTINDRFEEICEAWGMAADENTVLEIKQGLSDASKKEAKEIPDWREALAAMSD